MRKVVKNAEECRAFRKSLILLVGIVIIVRAGAVE
jgi:hypothetical protein